MKASGEFTGVIPATHPALAGHFAGNPITPGVVLLNQLARTFAEWQVAAHSRAQICEWPLVKFVSPLRPDQPFTIRWTPSAGNTARFTLNVGERVVVTGLCVFEQRP